MGVSDLKPGFEEVGQPGPARSPRLTVADLGVLSFYVEDPKNIYLAIWREEQKWPIGETCFRTLIYGPAAEIAQVELPNERNVPMRSRADRLQGAAAYKFMLRLVTGLESRREGDSHITAQFKEGWTRFEKADPLRAAPMDRLVQHLIADARLVVSNFAKGVRTQNIQNAAKLLAGHKGGQRVVVIGNGTADRVSPVTISLARILSTPGRTSVSEIGVAHPDPAVRARIVDEFETLQALGKLDRGLMLRDIPPEELPAAFENYDRVYCDLPMEQDEAFDAKMIAAWAARERMDNRFMHLRGAIARQGTSAPAFEAAAPQLRNYFSPEQIMERNAEIGATNMNLRARANALVDFITEKRLAGEHFKFEQLVERGLIDAPEKPADPKPA